MKFIEHDRVLKYLGNAVEHGVVVQAMNRATREFFLIVWIEDGPRKNTREYTSKGWRPLIDWDDGPGHLSCRCRECERLFRSPLERPLCRTCAVFTPERQRRPLRDPDTPVYQPTAASYQPRPDDDDLPF